MQTFENPALYKEEAEAMFGFDRVNWFVILGIACVSMFAILCYLAKKYTRKQIED